MKRYFYLLIILLVFGCDNERILELPEIENAEITEVFDVSPAYIFYDETQPDSTLFNRKNLIGTTNWLVNVDKRLTLQQAIPHIQYLQEKRKKASMHKNENAKNYFTCNDTSIENLGFVEFTGLNYVFKDTVIDLNIKRKIVDTSYRKIKFDSIDSFSKLSGIHYRLIDLKFGFKNGKYFYKDNFIIQSETEIEKSLFFDFLNHRINRESLANAFKIRLHLSSSLSFQEYMTIKSNLSMLNSKMYIIEKEEFIY